MIAGTRGVKISSPPKSSTYVTGTGLEVEVG